MQELDINPAHALLELNLPSPQIRRNIAIRGLLHKRILGLCHPDYDRVLSCYRSRLDPLGHNKQLYGHNVEVIHCQALWH